MSHISIKQQDCTWGDHCCHIMPQHRTIHKETGTRLQRQHCATGLALQETSPIVLDVIRVEIPVAHLRLSGGNRLDHVALAQFATVRFASFLQCPLE